MAKKKNTTLYVAAFLLFLGGVGYLAYSGFTENSIYFLNVSEARAAPKENLNNARLFGTVSSEDLHSETPSSVSFRLEDKEDKAKTIMVSFKGTIPDTFKAGAEVIIEGSLTEENLFTAKTLMTKCPSKYQNENRDG